MHINGIRRGERALVIQWADGVEGIYPFLWLRDNDPSGFHPDTHERTFDLLSVQSDISPSTVEHTPGGDELTLTWPDLEGSSRYSTAWLASHGPGKPNDDPARIAWTSWDAQSGSPIPRFPAADLMMQGEELLACLRISASHGLAIVVGLEPREEAGLDLGALIGPMRNSNFDLTYDVVSKPDPNNSAYTADALPLHTDLPNQEIPPGYQFLHCIDNSAEGGGSLFCDGLKIAENHRASEPEHFDLLSGVTIPFRFHDATADIRVRRPVITLDESGQIIMIAFNAHIADTFDMAPDVIPAYYDAYRHFMAMVRDPAYLVEVELDAGEMVVFDNRRVLHGRAEFFPQTGHRHLKGFYIDRADMESRIRVLSRRHGSGVEPIP